MPSIVPHCPARTLSSKQAFHASGFQPACTFLKTCCSFSLAGVFSSALGRKDLAFGTQCHLPLHEGVHLPWVRSLSEARLDFLSVRAEVGTVGAKADSLPELQALGVYTPRSLVAIGLPRGAILAHSSDPQGPALLGCASLLSSGSPGSFVKYKMPGLLAPQPLSLF